MTKRMILRALLGLALVFGTVAKAATDDALSRVKAAGSLKVGTDTAFAPFDFIDAGQHVGLNVDLFQEVGQEMGVKIEWVPLPRQALPPGLEAGQVDMVAGPTPITKASMQRYRFLPPVGEITDALLKRKGDTTIMKPADMAGKTVGVGKTSPQLAQLKTYAKTLPSRVTIREYVDDNDAYADLARGRLAAVAASLSDIRFAAKQRPDTFDMVDPPFGPKSYLGYIIPKDAGHAALADALQAAMLKIKADGRLAALQRKWFGAAFDTPDAVIEPAL